LRVRERLLVLVCYFLSGVCGLVYEVVWMRRLALTFGITVFATSTVLAVFMAGLALGSWLVARRIDRSPNPVRVYAWLEIGIGIYALAVPAIFWALEPLYVMAANLLEGQFLLFNLVRGLLAFAALLLPTTLMGGTVPAIGRYLVERSGAVGWNVGLLYALNTFGAVAGCVAAGFWLVPALGMSRTILMAATTNIAIGVVLLAARIGDRSTAPSPVSADDAAPASSRIALLAGLVFAFSGFSALAYEVVWTRVLVVHVHNTTYAFTVMLAVFLAGLAIGDAVLVPLYDRLRRPLLWLGIVEVLIGLSVVVAAAAYVPFRSERHALTSWESALGLMVWRAGLVLLPGALLFGMTFPLTARVVCLEGNRVGRALGLTYAANTVGAIGGALAGGFLLIPFLGLRGTLVLLSVLNIGLGALCWLAATRGVARIGLVAAALALLVVPWRGVPTQMFFEALETREYRLIYYREGVTDTTGVWESRTDGHRVVTYGDLRGTAGTHTDAGNRLQAHLAHLLHPQPRRSLQICFGVGNTLAAAALHPEVEQLDCVELSPHVRQTAAFFWTNANVLADARVRLIIDDGRNFLLRNRQIYDVITLEPPDIFTAGVVNLYTEEFYRLAARALAEDGLICQWLPVGEMAELDIRMLVQAFVRVFPETSLWEQGKNGPLLLIGSKTPLRIDAARLAARMQHPRVQADLVRIGRPRPASFFDLFIAGPAGTRRWLGDVPAVTDDHTVVDFATPKRLQSGFGFGYFRLQGAERQAFHRHMGELQALYGRLREPIETLLVPPATTAGAGS
jgi:spermidine synthase